MRAALCVTPVNTPQNADDALLVSRSQLAPIPMCVATTMRALRGRVHFDAIGAMAGNTGMAGSLEGTASEHEIRSLNDRQSAAMSPCRVSAGGIVR
jgi:hypothetical protein